MYVCMYVCDVCVCISMRMHEGIVGVGHVCVCMCVYGVCVYGVCVFGVCMSGLWA